MTSDALKSNALHLMNNELAGRCFDAAHDEDLERRDEMVRLSKELDAISHELTGRPLKSWREGPPDDYGRYLIEYEQHGQQRVFIGGYDPVEERWYSLDDATVLRWAEIKSPFN